MPEFDDLFDELVPQGTVTFTLSRVRIRCDKPVELVMRHAGDANPEYKSARAKISREFDAYSSRNDSESVQTLLHKLYARTVVKDWRNANDKEGAPLPYTPERGEELFRSLAAKGAYDEIGSAFAYAANADNFRGSPTAAAEHLGK